MKHLIIGAGATLAEAQNLGCPSEFHPPLIRDFAQKTWMNYAPHPILEEYLHGLGYTDLGDDPRKLFYRLERQGDTNIERFLEFAWMNRNKEMKIELGKAPPGYISGLRTVEAGSSAVEGVSPSSGDFWDNLLYHGIGSPLAFLMTQCFFENGRGWKDLALSKVLASSLGAGDLILNLNYDTVFELALQQLNKPFVYLPNASQGDDLLVCKPHGSLNLVSNDRSFTFGQPEWLGMPQPREFRSYSGLIPPRLNKSYKQHQIAQLILEPTLNRRPDHLIMWGVGLTESDVELTELFQAWGMHATRCDVINPSKEVSQRVRKLLGCEVRQFASVVEWR